MLIFTVTLCKKLYCINQRKATENQWFSVAFCLTTPPLIQNRGRLQFAVAGCKLLRKFTQEPAPLWIVVFA